MAEDLAALDYTVEGVRALLGEEAHRALDRDQLIPALLASADDDGGLAAAVRLWLLAEPVSPAAVAAAFPSTGLDSLRFLGLIEDDPSGAVRAAVDLRPYGWAAERDGSGDVELWIASDLGAHQRTGVLRRDHVLGIGQASLTLAQSTVRRPVERALDLGTGCGIQTFHLLSHARHVVATDISARALAFSRFNLLLNAPQLGIERDNLAVRVELRLGSLLEPVAGEKFDLVVSNPPFVITPRNSTETAGDQFTYRDGGLAGDEIVAALVHGLPSVLAPGGTAQLLGNWEIQGAGSAEAAGSWSLRPESWLRSTADAWFIQREVLEPGQYAETWLQDASEGRDRNLYAASYREYLQDFASRAVTGIGFGMIWLRAVPAGAAPFIRRFEEIPHPIEQPIGPHLGQQVERADWLAALDRDAGTLDGLAGEHLVVAGDVTEERHQRPGAEHPGVILLRQGAGLRRTTLLSTELAGFASACDGDLSVGQIIGALAALLNRDDGADGSRNFTVQLLHDVRNLVLDGFLLPAEIASR
ncbi:methyltransferase [Paenarthrobacter sp. Z7-10]|nr:methyltransferase [Paenarthrobacter sp. Z7-10]